MSALLELDGLIEALPRPRTRWAGPRGAVRAVDGISLAVERRARRLAIVGESGCGKSTLGRLALRLIEPDRGAVRFMGEDLRALGPGAAGAPARHADHLPGPLRLARSPHDGGGRDRRAAELHHVVPRGAERARVASLLERVGLRAGGGAALAA